MASGFRDWSRRVFSSAENFEQLNWTQDDTEDTNSFSQEVKSVLIYNDGPNPVHMDFDDTATTSEFKIPAKAWLMIDLKFTDLHSICDTDHTAECYVIGTY